MALAADDFLAGLCPQLLTDQNHDMYIAIAELSLDAPALEEHYQLALALMAAHSYTLDQTRPMGDGGRISLRTEGRISVGYQEPRSTGGPDRSELLLTQYGQRLKSLFKRAGLFAEVSGGTAAVVGR